MSITKTKIKLLEAINVTDDPESGVKAFVRRTWSGVTINDEEIGKFIFPPGGSFLIFLSNPEAWEEKINC